MAFVSIQHVLIDNAEGVSGMLAGMAVHLDSVNGVPTVKAADRSDTTHRFYGVLADDTTNTGNTSAIVDPVSPGNYSHDLSDGYTVTGMTPYGPEFVAHPARVLGDYKDTRITNTTDWDTPPGTYKRGVTVYRVGGRFLTDQFVSTASTSSATADAGAAPTFVVGSPLTFGAGVNAGKWILVSAPGTHDANTGTIARVTNPSTANGLLEIALV